MPQFLSHHRYKRRLHTYFSDWGGGPSDCVLLAGSHRSGTTWVAELLNYRNEYRMMFEPFWGEKVRAAKSFKICEWIPRGQGTEEQLAAADAIFSGKVRNRWVDEFNRRRISRLRLVKEIRANLMLGWIREHFPTMPIVFVMRHPCAVAASVLKLEWDNVLPQLASQAAIQDRFGSEIAMATTPYEGSIVRWCIEHAIAIQQTEQANIPVFHYEHLCSEQREEVAAALFRSIGKNPHGSLRAHLDRPSMLARTNSAVVTGESVLHGWRSQVSTAQIDYAVDMLERFGLDHLYGAESMPKVAPAIGSRSR